MADAPLGPPSTPPRAHGRWWQVAALLLVGVVVIGGVVLLGHAGARRPAATDAPSAAAPSSLLPAPPPGSPVAPAPSVVAPTIVVPSLPTCVPTAPTPIRVATFNIHGGRSHTTYDLGRIADEIATFDADVVLLEEVHRFRRYSGFTDQPAYLAERLGMTPVFGVTYTRDPEGPGRPRRESGNLVLSRLPVLDSGNVALPNFPGLEQRALLHVDVEVGDQVVRVYATHLQHTSNAVRVVQAQAVRRIAQAHPGPFLLGGDLNATPASQPVARLEPFFSDPWPAVGTGDGLTAPARAPRVRIDYVLYGGGPWVPRQAQTVPSAVSDHRAVVVDQELPAATACPTS